MKKYIRLSCTVCRRTTDRLVDNARAVPDKCNITLACQGRLNPVEYRSDAQITPTPAAGVTDWLPRGTVTSGGTAPQEVELVDTSTGQLQQLVIAIPMSVAPSDLATATVVFEEKPQVPVDFRSFTYLRDELFDTLSGPEDGLARKVLRFRAWGPDPDVVSVFINGVQITQGPGPNNFQVDDGSPTPPAPPDTVKFNTPILPTGTDQIEIVVSRAAVSTQEAVVFKRNVDNDARLDLGAWENVSHIDRFDYVSGLTRFFLFTFDVKGNASLTRDSIIFPIGDITVADGGITSFQRNHCFFALARSPFSSVDRYPDAHIFLDTIDGQDGFLKYSTVNGALTLQATASSISSYFPPSIVGRFNPEETIKTSIDGSDDTLVVDGGIVVGPDT